VPKHISEIAQGVAVRAARVKPALVLPLVVVTVAAFGGVTATYQFSYQTQTVYARCNARLAPTLSYRI
jgi:hypothetical protein